MRRNILYAPRVQGDLDLGLEPTRIETTALATTGKGLSRLITPGGLLPGQSEQGVYEGSVTQKYRIGSRMVVDDRVFRYGKATEALIRNMGALNSASWPINAATLTATTIATSQIKVVEATCSAGDYAGGYIVLFTSPLQIRRILGNDASDGTEAILYVDGAWELGGAIGTWATGYKSIFRAIQAPPAAAPNYVSFICVPLISVTINYYFWGQTWGPCYGVADGTVPGSAANKRDLYFASSGNLEPYGDGAAGVGGQYAGYIIPTTSLGSGDQFYMLSLQP
ncbi:hypothetical protein LCGC14_1312740 [marine sediment metagenome]|uniref:Uncharacterized protein n=1 Tax=marine sediment metagenome TaxID=412755 RepID=A0A0F9NP73_9ZZZZ